MPGRLSSRFFSFLVAKPLWALLPLLLLFALSLVGLKGLTKDTRSDAFMHPDNPALVYRDRIKDQFGLSDPLIIALLSKSEGGVYTPATLAAIANLTEAVKTFPNVNESSVVSLATESRIMGSEADIEVEPLLDVLPQTLEEAGAIREAVNDFPLYRGSLAAEAGQATIIVVEVRDINLSEQTYHNILELLEDTRLPEGVSAHVAGEAAVSGYLGAYIDADAQRLNPLAALIIVSMVLLAFRRVTPALMAVWVIFSSIALSLGTMATLGIPFYVITNALPVILIGISVADTIHIYSHLFRLQAADPQCDFRELVVKTMEDMWLPVTLTSITTAAGFLGLYFAAEMPPFRFFGLFAALGVTAAWIYSIIGLPSAMVLLPAPRLAPGSSQSRGTQTGLAAGLVLGLGRLTLRFPRTVVAGFLVAAVVGGWLGSQLTVDDERIRLFRADEPIVEADRVINEFLNGSGALDVVIETPDVEGLFEPSVLGKIDKLQRYAESLPHVTASASIVDYLKQINRVFNGGDQAAYRLPDSRDLVAQYFLFYSFSGDPSDFEQEVDYDYRTANVRLRMDSGRYSDIKPVVEALQSYLAREFTGEVKATLSGRATINYHWIKNIGDSHLKGLLIALLLVWGVSSLSFRSTLAGVYTLLPVVSAILLVYAFMVWRGIALGVGTSMFAAVAIGLGVDFAIHTISRLRALYPDDQGDLRLMYEQFFTSTGRVLLLNVLVVACGFAVLIISKVNQLKDFGSIVVLTMAISFLASTSLLPALVSTVTPRFIRSGALPRESQQKKLIQTAIAVALVTVFSVYLINTAHAETEDLSADEIVERINAVPEGEQVTRKLAFRTMDRRGRSRLRETVSYRRYFGTERRAVIFFTTPANIRGTAVLTWDYAEKTRDDDQWLYLPALRKVRRIPGADRGDYFLGTDFSFEDMKLDGKLSVADYEYRKLPSLQAGTYLLEGLPRSSEIARELGYSRTVVTVDSGNWMVTRVEFDDLKGERLKTLQLKDIQQIDGFWTRPNLLMENHQKGHSTEIMVTDIDYHTPIPERTFSQQTLQRGM